MCKFAVIPEKLPEEIKEMVKEKSKGEGAPRATEGARKKAVPSLVEKEYPSPDNIPNRNVLADNKFKQPNRWVCDCVIETGKPVKGCNFCKGKGYWSEPTFEQWQNKIKRIQKGHSEEITSMIKASAKKDTTISRMKERDKRLLEAIEKLFEEIVYDFGGFCEEHSEEVGKRFLEFEKRFKEAFKKQLEGKG